MCVLLHHFVVTHSMYTAMVFQVPTYEILVGDMRGLRWVDSHGRLNLSLLGYAPVEGGRDSDGSPLFVARAHYKDAVHPGKVSEKLNGMQFRSLVPLFITLPPAAIIPYDGTEKEVKVSRLQGMVR
jgi:hypothetical protein